jgi:hypothetical protein
MAGFFAPDGDFLKGHAVKFGGRRWETGLAQIQADREKAQEADAKGRASLRLDP